MTFHKLCVPSDYLSDMLEHIAKYGGVVDDVNGAIFDGECTPRRTRTGTSISCSIEMSGHSARFAGLIATSFHYQTTYHQAAEAPARLYS